MANPSVNAILLNDEYKAQLKKAAQAVSDSKDTKSVASSNSPACRICLFEGSDDVNPLIAPCMCDGTMKLIHLDCLRTWLNNKKYVKTTNSATSIQWKIYDCELCKTRFPNEVRVSGKQFEICEIERPSEGPYLLLESIPTSSTSYKTVHVINSNKSEMLIGRAHDCDIRVTDISVSRSHAYMYHQKGQFYIEDSQAKFGTLVMAKPPLKVPPRNKGNPLTIQVGRSMIQLCTVKPGISNACCCGQGAVYNRTKISTNPEEYDYTRFVKYFPNAFNIEMTEIASVSQKKISELMQLIRMSNKNDPLNESREERLTVDREINSISSFHEQSQKFMMSDERCKSNSIHKNVRAFIEDSHDLHHRISSVVQGNSRDEGEGKKKKKQVEENKEIGHLAEVLGVDQAEVARFQKEQKDFESKESTTGIFQKVQVLNNPEPSDREDLEGSYKPLFSKSARNASSSVPSPAHPIKSRPELDEESKSLIAEALMEMDAANPQMEEEKLFDGPLRPAYTDSPKEKKKGIFRNAEGNSIVAAAHFKRGLNPQTERGVAGQSKTGRLDNSQIFSSSTREFRFNRVSDSNEPINSPFEEPPRCVSNPVSKDTIQSPEQRPTPADSQFLP